MPKKTEKPKGKKIASKDASTKSASGHTYNIDNVHAGRDVIVGNQSNTIHQTAQTLNVSTPVEFIEELQKLREEIARLKSLSDVSPAAIRRLFAVEGDIVEAIVEAKKEEPAAERINSTLDGAKETMEKLGGSITTAVSLGTTLGNLALMAWKIFGGG
jgi:hypothetical protein